MNEDFLKLTLSFIISSLLGLERQLRRKPAGLRTHILVGLGSTIFTILSYKYFNLPNVDPSRIASNVVTGIGFVGAGTILKEEDKVIGITTAASLWLTSAIGMAIGIGAYELAIFGTFLGIISLLLKFLEKYVGDVEL